MHNRKGFNVFPSTTFEVTFNGHTMPQTNLTRTLYNFLSLRAKIYFLYFISLYLNIGHRRIYLHILPFEQNLSNTSEPHTNSTFEKYEKAICQLLYQVCLTLP